MKKEGGGVDSYSQVTLEDAVRRAIDEHDRRRISVQQTLASIWRRAAKEIAKVEEGLLVYVEEMYTKEDTMRQELICTVTEKFYSDSASESEQDAGIELAKGELLRAERDFVVTRKSREGKLWSCMDFQKVPRKGKTYGDDFFRDSDRGALMEKIVLALKEKAETHYESKIAEGDCVEALIREVTERVEEAKDAINAKLEAEYKREDSRLQSLLMDVLRKGGCGGDDGGGEQSLWCELITEQEYRVLGRRETMWLDVSKICILDVRKNIKTFGERKMECAEVYKVDADKVHVVVGKIFTCAEEKALLKMGIKLCKAITVKVQLIKACDKEKYKEEEDNDKAFTGFGDDIIQVYVSKDGKCTIDSMLLQSDTAYALRFRAEYLGKRCKWSDWAEFKVPNLAKCAGWKTGPRYLVDNSNSRLAKCTESRETAIVGCPALPPGKRVSWRVIIRNAHMSITQNTFVGVAPYDIDQSAELNSEKCGWYFHCYDSTLYSGPPHNYKWPGKPYEGGNVQPGNIVSVYMNTVTGDLEFGVNGNAFSPGFEGVPLDKPLVPCVIVQNRNDIVELTDVKVYSGKNEFGIEKKGCIIN